MDGAGYNWKTSYGVETFGQQVRNRAPFARACVNMAARLNAAGVDPDDFWLYIQAAGAPPANLGSVYEEHVKTMHKAFNDLLAVELDPIKPEEIEMDSVNSFKLLNHSDPIHTAMRMAQHLKQTGVDLWKTLPEQTNPEGFPFAVRFRNVKLYENFAKAMFSRRKS